MISYSSIVPLAQTYAISARLV